jgi:hypothetical protein
MRLDGYLYMPISLWGPSPTQENCDSGEANLADDLMADALREIVSFRSALIENGFSPVPLYGVDATFLDSAVMRKTSAGKAPAGLGWPAIAKARTEGWAEPATTNTGVLCDGLCVFDVDVDDHGLVNAVREAAERLLGPPATERRRQGASRVAWPYRAAVGSPKKRRVRNDATGQMVEVLGEGNQLCVGFLHCKLVGSEYGDSYDRVYSDIEWTVGLDEVKVTHLPAVTEDQVAAFLDEVRLILEVPDAPPNPVYVQPRCDPAAVETQPLSNEELRDLIGHLPPADCAYDEWSCFISAIRKVTGGSPFGLALAHDYSRNSSIYDPRGVDRKWREVANSPTVHGVGFLINQARAHSNWLSLGAKAAVEKPKQDEDLRGRLRLLRAKSANANRPTRPDKMDLEF